MPAKARRGERVDHECDHLGVSRRARDADQLDAALEELARLPAPALDGAVGMREVAQPQRLGDALVAIRHQAGDRDRRVRAEREHVALVVEQAEARAGRGVVAAPQHVLVLDRGRPDLAVAGLLEDLMQAHA